MNNSSNNITEETNIKFNGDNKIINFNNYLIQILIGLFEENSFNILDYYEHFDFYEDLLNIFSNTIICNINYDNKENKSNEKNINSIITIFKKILIPLINNENKDILNDIQKSLLINFVKEHLFIDEYIELVFINNKNKEISNQFYELLSIIIIKINSKEENEQLYKYIYQLINDENKINKVTDSLYKVLFVFIKNMNIEEYNTTKKIFMSLYDKLFKEKDLDNLNIIGEILEYLIFEKEVLIKEEDIMEKIQSQFNYELMEIIFNASINFLILIAKKMQYNNESITNDFIYNYIQKLYRYCEKNNSRINKINIVKFIYGILEINDIYTPNRVHSLLGYPALIIKKDKNSILPLLGIKLMNNNINEEIFEYINYNHIRKNRCILAILFPSSYEINNKDNLDENDRLDLIYELIEASLGFNKIKEGNYYLFKYLYLMQSRTIKYENLFDEIKKLLENANKNNNNKYDLTKLRNIEKKCIELINYETKSINLLIDLNSSNSMNEKTKYNTKPELPDCLKASNVILNEKKNKDYIGLISDIVPDEIGKININLIASNDNLSIFKFEYFLTYFTKKELMDLFNEKKNFIYQNIRRNINAIEKNNIIDNNNIYLDISILKEKSDEEFIKYIKDNLKEKKTIIIENKEILENKVIKSCLIRYYILSQNKDSVFKINIRMNEMQKDIENNFYIPNIIYDNVEKNNSNNIINIHRIKNNLRFLENNSIGTIFSNINYEKYFNEYIN